MPPPARLAAPMAALSAIALISTPAVLASTGPADQAPGPAVSPDQGATQPATALSPSATRPAGLYPASAPWILAGPRLDPDADRILRAWAEHLRSARRFTVRVEAAVRLQDHAAQVQRVSVYRLAVERPNRLALLPRNPSDPAIVSDGRTLYASLPIVRRFSAEPAPASLDDLRSGNVTTALVAACSTLTHLRMLLASDPIEPIASLATEARYRGTENLGESPCHHLQVNQHHFALNLWIDAGQQPLLRQVALSMSPPLAAASSASGPTPATLAPTPAAPAPPSATAPATPPPAMAATPAEPAAPSRLQAANVLGIAASLRLADWAIDPELPPATFRFSPPAGARQVENLLVPTRRE